MRIKTLISTFLIIGATSTGFTVGVKIIEVKDYKSNIFKAPANNFSISLDSRLLLGYTSRKYKSVF